MAARGDLAGGESHGAWVTGHHGKKLLGYWARRGARPGW
jgi:hypothetical protein